MHQERNFRFLFYMQALLEYPTPSSFASNMRTSQNNRRRPRCKYTSRSPDEQEILYTNFFIFLQGLHHSAPNLKIKTTGFIFNNSINTSRPM
jgi:hypothetical protein